MRNPTTLLIAVTVLLAGSSTRAAAQTAQRDGLRLFGGVSFLPSLWDDETFLGRGWLVSGGVAQPLGRHASVEGELAWGTHHRDSGYLIADGHPLMGTARLVYAFQQPASRARAFVSAGAGVVRSTGHFTTRSFLPGPGVFPIEGPLVRTDWSVTKSALEVGAGVSIAAGPRLALRPEVRWTSTAGASPSEHGTIEPPIWILRTGLTVEWRR